MITLIDVVANVHVIVLNITRYPCCGSSVNINMSSFYFTAVIYICMSPNTVPDDICLRTHNQTVASFETLEMINTLEKKYPS